MGLSVLYFFLKGQVYDCSIFLKVLKENNRLFLVIAKQYNF